MILLQIFVTNITFLPNFPANAPVPIAPNNCPVMSNYDFDGDFYEDVDDVAGDVDDVDGEDDGNDLYCSRPLSNLPRPYSAPPP